MEKKVQKLKKGIKSHPHHGTGGGSGATETLGVTKKKKASRMRRKEKSGKGEKEKLREEKREEFVGRIKGAVSVYLYNTSCKLNSGDSHGGLWKYQKKKKKDEIKGGVT